MAHDPTAAADLLDDFLSRAEPRLSPAIRAQLKPLLRVCRHPARTLLLREGQHSKQVYVILQGASRSFYVHKGVEVHTWFAFENELIGSLHNFDRRPARASIQLLEDSLLVAIDISGLQDLMRKELTVAQFVHEALLEYALFMEDKMRALHMKTAKERYEALLAQEPEIVRRVPLTYIASYLGISRETLSRLRAR